MRFGWKTLAGAAVWALGQLSSPEILAVLPGGLAKAIGVAGAVLAAVGVRHAIAKNGQGV